MDKRLWCVYVHTNKTNGKRYIGITSQKPEQRWMNGHGYDEHLHMGRAIRKYGWDGFDHDILFTGLCAEEAYKIEKELIAKYKTRDERYGYNMTDGGEGRCGYHLSDKERQRISKMMTGENHPNYGKHLSETTRSKICLALTGNKNALGAIRSAETKERISASKRKPVAMCLNGVICCVFDSAKEAQEKTGISRKNISLCCLGYRKNAGGYNWKFA